MNEIAIVVTWPMIVAVIGGIPCALAVIVRFLQIYTQGVKLLEHQAEQDTEIKEVNAELAVLSKGVLACLQGLHEKGCNGPVTEAIRELEAHITRKAHK